MKKLVCLIVLLILPGCQPAGAAVTLLADGHTYTIRSTNRIPQKWLDQLHLALGENDRLVDQGDTVLPDQPLPSQSSYTLILRRALDVVIHTPTGEKNLQTSAWTVGETLQAAGFSLYSSDRIDPPADTLLDSLDASTPIQIDYQPSRELTLTTTRSQIQIRSAAATVGQALAQAGLPLLGLDFSVPAESSALPADGKIKLIRVSESVALTESTIPYKTRTELSADLELDQQGLIQGGEPGLKISRIRTRTEDGVQVSQTSDGESLVRPPQDRILGIGTKVNIKTAVVDGQTIQYWRSMTVYTTPYAPCIPQTPTCRGGSSTASGTRVRKGEVAMVYPWYLLLAGERIYVPGYGFATVEDNNGANTSAYWGTHWIDLGYPDMESINWVNQYVTIYFLAPVPANIADLYVMP